MNLTPRQWLLLALAAALVIAGWHYRSLLDDRADLKVAKGAIAQQDADATATDQAVADKLKTDGAIDRGVNRAMSRNQETARHEPSYREYLDRPLPADALRLYRDAAEAVAEAQGTDRTESEDDQDDH